MRTPTSAITARKPYRLLATALAAVVLCGAPAMVASAAAASPASASLTVTTNAATTAVPTVTRPAGVPLDADNVTLWLEGMLPGMLEREGIPGAVVSVVAGGAVIAQGDYGSARRADAANEKNRLDPASSVVRVGGAGTLLTGIAVMQLVQAGDLDLDAPVSDYLDFTLDTNFSTPLTLRHLLSHTAGFEDRVGAAPNSQKDLVALKQWVSSEQPEQIFAPGTTPAYSSYGIDLAGYVVEHIAGVPFAAYMTDQVLVPLGMGNSTFAQPLPAELAEWAAPAYVSASGAATGFEYVNGVPSSALSSTAAGMGRLLAFAGGGLPESSSVLSLENRALMLQPALGEEQLGGLATAPVMGLAWQDESRNGHRIYGQVGDLVASHSGLQLYPDDGAGIFISLTGAGASADSASFIRGAVLDAFADRYFPLVVTEAAPDAAAEATAETPADDTEAGTDAAAAEPAEPRAPVAGVVTESTSTGAEHAAAAAGSYELSRTVRSNYGQMLALTEQVQLTAGRDGVLHATLPIGVGGAAGPATFHEIDDWLWQEVGGQQLLAMRVEDGAVQAISISPTLTLLPVETLAAAPLALPLLLGALAVLIITLVCWPIAAVLRNRHDVEWPLSGPSRAARVLLILSAIATVLAAAGWLYGLHFVVGNEIGIRVLQVLTLLGALGVIPAVWNLVQGLRKRRGFGSVLWALLLVAAFAVVGYYAWTLQLLALNISY